MFALDTLEHIHTALFNYCNLRGLRNGYIRGPQLADCGLNPEPDLKLKRAVVIGTLTGHLLTGPTVVAFAVCGFRHRPMAFESSHPM